ncbi:MAG: SDR family NAD(P)-dependent oxidoreductase [Woeseiaceae bacterium]|nr:SDR family NAD(P)-dependent oxidoreductase [Woeseiaceae bacterium]
MGSALITGASAGLGSEFARQLAAQGKDLILVARRAEPMEALAADLRDAYGVAVDVLTADMTDPGAPGQLVAETRRRGLDVDFLINNAGSEGPDLIHTRDWQRHDAYLRLMMTSVAAMCHEFMPAMIENGYGRVINVASVAGQLSVAGDYSYGPTKAYLIALSKALASTYRDQGVYVLALCPGFTHTDFHASDRLTEMKSGMPKWLWYDADVVIREGLTALEKGKPEYTSGRLYRILVPILRLRFTQGLIRLFGVKI